MKTVEIAAYFPNEGTTVSNFSKGAVCVLRTTDNKHRKVFTFKAKKGVNVREEELEALLQCLKLLKNPSRVNLYTNSSFIYKGLNEWIGVWQFNGWITVEKQPVKHQKLWNEIYNLMIQKNVCIHLTSKPSHTIGGNTVMDDAYMEFININSI